MSNRSAKRQIRPWTRGRTQTVLETPVFSIEERLARSPRTEQEHAFYVMDGPDWVNVVALLDSESVLMIRQYRHGSDEVTLEIPGGMMDQDDGGPTEAARRELLEETGYEAGSVRLIGNVAPNPAIQTNRCYTCLATDLRDTGQQQFDADEDIDVLPMPLATIPDLLHNGTITHSLVVVAFCWFLGLREPSHGTQAP